MFRCHEQGHAARVAWPIQFSAAFGVIRKLRKLASFRFARKATGQAVSFLWRRCFMLPNIHIVPRSPIAKGSIANTRTPTRVSMLFMHLHMHAPHPTPPDATSNGTDLARCLRRELLQGSQSPCRDPQAGGSLFIYFSLSFYFHKTITAHITQMAILQEDRRAAAPRALLAQARATAAAAYFDCSRQPGLVLSMPDPKVRHCCLLPGFQRQNAPTSGAKSADLF